MKSFDARGVMETESWDGAPAPVSSERIEVPARYEIERELGRGGFAVVYAAHDHQLDRKVALKVLQRRHGAEQEKRLVREAQVLAKLRHPSVVTVYDVTSHAGRVIVAMELVDGSTLRAWARGKPIAEQLRACVAAGRGLAAVHAADLVHRDFKPDNVLVDHLGRSRGDRDGVRVADFGLARIARDADDDPSSTSGGELHTATGALVGTVPYMAPELLVGKPADARSDQFAFAVTLVEVLGGKRPFAGSTLEAYEKSLADPPVISDRIPGWVRAIAERALAKDPAARFESMAALLAELDRDPRRRRNRMLALGGTTLATGGVIAAFALPRGESLACELPASLEAAWSAEHAVTVRAAFDAVKADPIERESAIASLDGYRDRLADAHLAACRALATESPELAASRAVCLERRTVELATLVDYFEHATPAIVDRAQGAIVNLSSIDDCASVAALAGRELRSAPTLEEGALLDLEIGRARVALDLGFAPLVKAQLEELMERADRIKHAPTAGEVHMLLGAAAEALDKHADAEREYHAALVLAQEGRDDELLVRAASSLGLELIRKQNRPLDGRPWIDLAMATVSRVSPEIESRARFALAIAELAANRVAEAETAGLRAYELCARLRGESSPNCANMMNTLGGIALAKRDLPEAAARYTRARMVLEQLHGRDHVTVFVPMSNLASVAYARGEFARSVELREDLVARATRVSGAKHFNVANTTLTLGMSLERAGKLDDAIARTKAGLDGMTAARGPEFERTREARLQLARQQVLAGDLAALDRVRDVAITPPQQIELFEIELEVARKRGDLATARRSAEAALAIVDTYGQQLARHESASRVAVAYAQLLRDAKDPKARDAAKRAVAMVEAIFASDAPPAREARALVE